MVKMNSLLKAIFMCAAVFGCGSTDNQKTPAVQEKGSLFYSVLPSDTESSISVIEGPHYAGKGLHVPSKNRLIVFLSGSGGSAAGCKIMLTGLAEAGFHVVSLDYPNKEAVGALALNNLAEYGLIRREIVEGDDASTLISVAKPDAIINRLKKLVTYLAVNRPSDEWPQFLTGSELDWAKITVSGLSQGAGHAAYIAQKYPVYRAVLFSGVVDGRVSMPYASADWILAPEPDWKTPFAKFRFFIHNADPYYARIAVNLVALGNNPADPLKAAFAEYGRDTFGGKNCVLASAPSSNPHTSTCADADTPYSENVAVYRNVWLYLFE